MTWEHSYGEHRFIAELDDGSRILSQRYGEGWSFDEARSHFGCTVWPKAVAAGSTHVIMGERFGMHFKRAVLQSEPTGPQWAQFGRPLPGLHRIEEE